MGVNDVYAGAVGGQASFDPAEPGFQAINPPSLFNGAALFSQIIVAPLGRMVWIAGQIGVGPDNVLVAGGKDAQIRQTFANVAAAITAAGCEPKHCTRLTEYIVNYHETDISLLQRAIRDLFPQSSLPTNVIVPVPRLGRDRALIEVELHCVQPS